MVRALASVRKVYGSSPTTFIFTLLRPKAGISNQEVSMHLDKSFIARLENIEDFPSCFDLNWISAI